MSPNNPTTLADLERKYDGPIPREERERVRRLEKEKTMHKTLERIVARHTPTRSWVPEVLAEGAWTGNGLRFANKEDAEAWVADLSTRWTAVRETRVIPSEEEPNK